MLQQNRVPSLSDLTKGIDSEPEKELDNSNLKSLGDIDPSVPTHLKQDVTTFKYEESLPFDSLSFANDPSLKIPKRDTTRQYAWYDLRSEVNQREMARSAGYILDTNQTIDGGPYVVSGLTLFSRPLEYKQMQHKVEMQKAAHQYAADTVGSQVSALNRNPLQTVTAFNLRRN